MAPAGEAETAGSTANMINARSREAKQTPHWSAFFSRRRFRNVTAAHARQERRGGIQSRHRERAQNRDGAATATTERRTPEAVDSRSSDRRLRCRTDRLPVRSKLRGVRAADCPAVGVRDAACRNLVRGQGSRSPVVHPRWRRRGDRRARQGPHRRQSDARRAASRDGPARRSPASRGARATPRRQGGSVELRRAALPVSISAARLRARRGPADVTRCAADSGQRTTSEHFSCWPPPTLAERVSDRGAARLRDPGPGAIRWRLPAPAEPRLPALDARASSRRRNCGGVPQGRATCPDDPTPLWLLGQFQSQRSHSVAPPGRPGGAVVVEGSAPAGVRHVPAPRAALPRLLVRLGGRGRCRATRRLSAQERQPFSARSRFRRALSLYAPGRAGSTPTRRSRPAKAAPTRVRGCTGTRPESSGRRLPGRAVPQSSKLG